MPPPNLIEGEVYIQRLALYIKLNEAGVANGLLAFTRAAPQAKSAKPVRLLFSLHHLYYLCEQLDSLLLDVDVGPLNTMLDNPNLDAPTFVLFLHKHARGASSASQFADSDAHSITLMLLVKTMMLLALVYWKLIGYSRDAKVVLKDLRYLYLLFTKLPCLILLPKTKVNPIFNYEEYPFDTLVPLKMFKNLQVLEITGYSPNEVHGWNRLSEQLRILVIKHTPLSDPGEVLYRLVRDDDGGRVAFGSMSTPRKYRDEDEQSGPHPPSASSYLSHSSLHLASSLYHAPGPHHAPGPYHAPSQHHANYTYGLRRDLLVVSHHRGRHRRDNSDSSSSSAYAMLAPHERLHHTTLNTSDALEALLRQPLPLHPLPDRKWALLRQLTLSDTSILDIPSELFRPFGGVVKLDLSHNQLRRLPGGLRHMPALRIVNLSGNLIEDLGDLAGLVGAGGRHAPLQQLESLNLSRNRLVSLANLELLPKLARLDIRKNRLDAGSAEPGSLRVVHRPFAAHWIAHQCRLREVYILSNPHLGRLARVDMFDAFNAVRLYLGLACELKLDESVAGYFESTQLMGDPECLQMARAYVRLVSPATPDDTAVVGDATASEFDLAAALQQTSLDDTARGTPRQLLVNQNIANHDTLVPRSAPGQVEGAAPKPAAPARPVERYASPVL